MKKQNSAYPLRLPVALKAAVAAISKANRRVPMTGCHDRPFEYIPSRLCQNGGQRPGKGLK